MKSISPVTLALVLAVVVSVAQAAALSESVLGYLDKYDDEVIYNIWRKIMYTIYYQFLPA